MVIVASEETQKKINKNNRHEKTNEVQKKKEGNTKGTGLNNNNNNNNNSNKREKKTKQNTINHTKRERGFDWWRRRWLSSASTRPIGGSCGHSAVIFHTSINAALDEIFSFVYPFLSAVECLTFRAIVGHRGTAFYLVVLGFFFANQGSEVGT